ncbi:MAG TPA: hypothetical protein VFM88_21960 [Vicinamibacteria bacterium]|nr:hypothetical protein [Vicinamibacteria bacterium]
MLRFALLALLATAIPLLQLRVDHERGAYRAQRSVLYLDKGEHVRRVVPGFEDLAADLYWLRTVQYYGGQRAFAREKTYALLRPLVEITVALDPRFELAYRYGAIFLSEPNPMGAGRPEDAIEILDQGIRALPLSWRLHFDKGTACYFHLKDPDRAAAALREGARLPEAPFWMESLAGRFLLSHDRAAAREIWQRQAEMSASYMRENAIHHLRLLDSLDLRDAAQALVDRFEREVGRRPASLHELVTRGYARSLPVDAARIPLAYDAQKGTVGIAYGSPFWRARYD